MKFNVFVVSPPGYIHSAAFAEVAETVHYGLAALGHDSVLTSGLVPELGRRPVIFGANLLAQLKLKPPPGAILYNLEQVQQGSAWLTPALLDLFRHYPVWDYSRRNVAQLVAMGVPTPALVPIGWAPQLSRIAPMAEDIDVLFYGSMNPRRQSVLEALEAQGVKVKVLFGLYGAERDAYVARSRLVLNIHYYEAKVFEVVRVSYLLANGRAVVSETGSSPEEEAVFAPGVAFATYEQLVPTCLRLVADGVARARLGAAGRALMQRRGIEDFLRAAMTTLKETP